MKSVAILGCGPAGLMVAHAAALSNWDFRVYSRKQKSTLYGAQYLHQPIPNIECGGPRLVRYKLEGTPEMYRAKVYGDSWDGTVSPEDFMESHSAWDLRGAYNDLWFMYGDEVEDMDFRVLNSDKMMYYPIPWRQCDIVISTVPRKIWAEPYDKFESMKVWALGDTEHERVRLHRAQPFTVECDGTEENDWYRVSNIFGYCTMEWPWDNYDLGFKPPPARGVSLVEKPLRHNSKAASDFIHLGRYGAWEKGILTSDVFYQAMKIFANDRI
jgi:hypothetical protein